MAQQIQHRNGTAAAWASANPVMAVGEMGIESDTARYKVGNGSTAWNSLAYGGINSGTFTSANFIAVTESINLVASAATGTLNFDILTASVMHYTTNATGNITLNFRGNSTTSLNTLMATGQSLTTAYIQTNGATAYYPTAYTIDGTSVTPKWAGSAPTAGNASANDVYTFTIVKTASATFTVYASVTKFA